MNRGMKRNAPLQQCQRGVLKFRVESDRHPFRQRGFRAPLGQLEKLRIGGAPPQRQRKVPVTQRFFGINPSGLPGGQQLAADQHFQNGFLPPARRFGVPVGTEAVGALRDSGEQRAFGEVQLRRGPPEVVARRRFDTVELAAVGKIIEVRFEDFAFGVLFLPAARQLHLAQLVEPRAGPPVGQVHQLHRDRGGAGNDPAVF